MPSLPSADDSEREFAWFTPAKRRASLYEDVTIDTQPSVHRHLNRGWPVSFEDGRGTWDDASTALQSVDWFAFRDPGEYWERPYYQREAAIEQQIDGAMQSAVEQGLIDDFGPEWIEFLRANLQVPAYVEHGLWFALATIGRACLSDSVATCVCLQAAMKQRSAQALVLYAMDLEQHHGPFPIAAAQDAFMSEAAWQPTRRYLERLAATPDWGEVIVAANLCFEPIVGTLLRRELGIRAAAAERGHGHARARARRDSGMGVGAGVEHRARPLSLGRSGARHREPGGDRAVDGRLGAARQRGGGRPGAARRAGPARDRDRHRGRARAGIRRARAPPDGTWERRVGRAAGAGCAARRGGPATSVNRRGNLRQPPGTSSRRPPRRSTTAASTTSGS